MSLEPSINQITREPGAVAQQSVLVVSPEGRIQFATTRAESWLRDLVPAAFPLDGLPEAVTRWLDNGASGRQPSRFVVEQPGGQLSFQVLSRETESVCLLLERSPGSSEPGGPCSTLTERQIEVLSWVARGKTNAEIGEILRLKTGTIGKYLERIFPKLGVENRTAAAMCILGAS